MRRTGATSAGRPARAKSRRYWLMALIGFSAAGLALAWTLWLGDSSFSTLFQTRALIAEQQAENERLETRNDNLAAEIVDLKTGEETMEERARMELGLIKEGEEFYRVVEVEDAPAQQSE